MPAGRPKKITSPEMIKTIENLAEIQCTMKEIAAVVNVSVDTLERNFADIIKKGQEVGKKSLRRKMFDLAYAGNGNVGMLIWLSKQHLDMTDKVDNKVETTQEMVFKVKWADEDTTGSDAGNAPQNTTTKKNK